MKELFETLKAEALPALWSQGVKLARAEAVTLQKETADELVLRVRAPGRVAYCTAVLYTEELEWTCDCAGPTDPCAHVIAAAIAANQAKQRGAPLAKATETGAQLAYVLRRLSERQMTLDRYIVIGTERSPLSGTLTSAQSRFDLTPGPGDLVADRIITASDRGILHPRYYPALLDALSEATVELDSARVHTSGDVVYPVARVVDDGRDVVLSLERNPVLTDVISFGLGRAGDTLRPLGLTDLAGLKHERLPSVRRFSAEELPELSTRVLPELESKLQVSVQSKRLPRVTRHRIAPRLMFELDHEEHTLSVLPLLVYGDPPQARIDAGKLVHLEGDLPERNEPAERRLLDKLRDELNLVVGRRVHFDGREADRFASALRQFQASLGERDLPLVQGAPLEPVVRIDGDRLQVEFRGAGATASSDPGEARGGGDADRPAGAGNAGGSPPTASADAVLRAWRDGLSLVPLDGGGWAPLPADWLSRYGDRIADLLAARDPQGSVARAAIPALAALCDDLDQPRPPSFAELEPLLDGFERIPKSDLPRDLTATLRPYQRAGVDWLSFLRDAKLGAVLADDMGLGKTLQTLCAVHGRTLVVCPKSVLHNWASEAQRFRPGLRTATYHGPRRRLDPRADLTITTYSILRLDAERLAAESWTTIVLDEAQAIKNPDSQVSRAAYGLSADFAVALSGTPLENRLDELWSLLHFTHRGLLGGRSDFRRRYAGPVEQGDREKLAELRQKTKPFILRRLKRDVAPELPPRTDVVLEVDLEDSERQLYQAIHSATRREVLEKLQNGGSVMRALEALLRLRQAACHPALVPGQQAETSSKVDALLEDLEQIVAEGHKALVFSQWTSLLDLVEPRLDGLGLSFARLDGATANRAEVVERFQSETGPPILLTSLKAGGTGLNLTAADHVFLLDPWWNPAAEDQAADRAHRIGQERPVLVYRLIAKDTVEERILALQEKKRGLAEAALEGTGTATGITREDLLALLE